MVVVFCGGAVSISQIHVTHLSIYWRIYLAMAQRCDGHSASEIIHKSKVYINHSQTCL